MTIFNTDDGEDITIQDISLELNEGDQAVSAKRAKRVNLKRLGIKQKGKQVNTSIKSFVINNSSSLIIATLAIVVGGIITAFLHAHQLFGF